MNKAIFALSIIFSFNLLTFSTTNQKLSSAINFLLNDDNPPITVTKFSNVTNAIGTQWGRLNIDIQNKFDPGPYIGSWNSSGIKWYRAEMRWEDYDSLSIANNYASSFNNSIMDKLFTPLLNNGITPYIMISGGNSSFTSSKTIPPILGWYHFADSALGKDFLSPSGFAKFCGAFAKFVNTYSYDSTNPVHYWEIGNEPHNFLFAPYYDSTNSLWGGGKWVSHFVNYFNSAATAIKAAQPTAKILSPGDDLFDSMKVYLPQIAKNVDILAIHPYMPSGDPTKDPYADPSPESSDSHIADFVNRAKENNIKEIWITEDGWDHVNFANNTNWGRYASEIGQTKYLLRALIYYTLSYNIKVFTQYNWTSTEFSMSNSSISALNNLHSWFGNADNAVATTFVEKSYASISINGNLDRSKLKQYLLVKNNKTLEYVFWLAIPENDNYQKLNAKLTFSFPNQLAIANIKSYDVIDPTKNSSLAYSISGKSLIIQGVQIADYPIFVEISLQ